MSSEAGRGLGEVADKAKAGLGNAARAGGETIRDGIGGAATRLRPAPREEPVPPPSGLEQLLAREEADARMAETPVAAPDLPLFAGEPIEAAAPPDRPFPDRELLARPWVRTEEVDRAISNRLDSATDRSVSARMGKQFGIAGVG